MTTESKTTELKTTDFVDYTESSEGEYFEERMAVMDWNTHGVRIVFQSSPTDIIGTFLTKYKINLTEGGIEQLEKALQTLGETDVMYIDYFIPTNRLSCSIYRGVANEPWIIEQRSMW